MSKPQYVHKLLLYIRFLLYNVTNPGIHMYRRHLDLFPLYSSVAAPTPMPSMPKRFPRSSMSSISFSRAKNSISTGTRTIPARFSSRGGVGTSRLPSASSGELKDNLASSSKFDTRKKNSLFFPQLCRSQELLHHHRGFRDGLRYRRRIVVECHCFRFAKTVRKALVFHCATPKCM